MEVIELKFLLKLLGKPNYQAAISEIKPNAKTTAAQRDKICRQLRDRNFVTCTEEITKIKIAPPGKALLRLDIAGIPVTPQELKILQACQAETITPGQTKITPAQTRQALIESLIERGFIEVAETKLKEVQITEKTKKYLLYEYNPNGAGNISLTKNMMADYLSFLRKNLALLPPEVEPTAATELVKLEDKPRDEEILKAIINLDQQLGTDNYLPLFHLRQKLQPPLSREELDRALYRLEQNNQIELSALQEVRAYTPEQIETGIPQSIGGRLFFIIVNY